MKEYMPLARTSEIVVLEVKDETLVYDLRVAHAHCLNESAAIVWKYCDGRTTINEISKLVESHFHTSAPSDFVWLALEQLQERDLLADGRMERISGTTRREMIKTIGMASIIAAPVIASMIAASSVYAAGSCMCVNPGACLTQTMCPNITNCNGSGICAP